jgi:pimeloyl-ACP methyl ester carboxylesterase
MDTALHTDIVDDTGAPYGISRRLLLGGGLTTLAFAAATAGAAAERAGPAAPPLPATPAAQMRLLMKLMASSAAASVPWFYTGRIYAVQSGLAPVHLFNFEGSEIYWIEPLGPDRWSMAVSTLTFLRDRVTGEYLDRFDNPLTGASVDVSPNVLRSKRGQGAVYAPQSMTIMGQTLPVTVEVNRNGAVVWLTTSRANTHAPQPSMEVNSLFASAKDVDDPARSSARATFTSVSLSRWFKWLEMGDREGHLLWHGAGRKLASLAELPASYRRRADALHSLHFTNPELEAPATPAAAAAPVAAAPAERSADPPVLRFSYVKGAGGVPLSMAEAGDARAPGILFIHGLGQSHMSFALQLHSPLASRFHLVAFDLRGHGNSAKPWDVAAYGETRVWADDVSKIIEASGLKRPLVVAWSYGTLVMADYVRHYGTDGLAGIVMIGALGGLASLPPAAFDPAIMAKIKELHDLAASPGLEDTLAASRGVVPLLTARPMPSRWTATSETVNALVPPFARTAMSARMMVNNSDLVGHMRVPMVLLAGSEDRGTPAALMKTLSDALPLHAEVKVYEGSGHTAFAEEPERFNQDLAAFAGAVFAA